MRWKVKVALLVTLGLAASACSISTSSSQETCFTGDIPEGLKARYSLGELPESSALQFCEKSDADGFTADMWFSANPIESTIYLTSLGMNREDFVPVPPADVSQLSHNEGEGWALKDGASYLRNRHAREWNGECAVDYVAYIPEGEAWNGDVFIGMYCQT